MPLASIEDKNVSGLLMPFFMERQKGSAITSGEIKKKYIELKQQDKEPGFFSRMTLAGSIALGSFFSGLLVSFKNKTIGGILTLSSLVGSIVIRGLRVNLQSEEPNIQPESKTPLSTVKNNDRLVTETTSTEDPVLPSENLQDDYNDAESVNYDELHACAIAYISENESPETTDENYDDIPSDWEAPNDWKKLDNVDEIKLEGSEEFIDIEDMFGIETVEELCTSTKHDVNFVGEGQFEEDAEVTRSEKFKLHICTLIESLEQDDKKAERDLKRWSNNNIVRRTILDYLDRQVITKNGLKLPTKLLSIISENPNEEVLGQLYIIKYSITSNLEYFNALNDTIKKIEEKLYNLTPQRKSPPLNFLSRTLKRFLTLGLVK